MKELASSLPSVKPKVGEIDGLRDRPNALLTWYFVSALLCIALRVHCTIRSIP